MIQFFLFFFFYCLSLSADHIDLSKSKIDQAKEQQHIFGYRECCGNNVFWCKNSLDQLMTMTTSLCVLFIGHRVLTFNPRTWTGEVIITRAPSSFKPILITSVALLYPYLCRYYNRGHLKPTCYKTALLSPSFFIEIPYFFYQNRKNKKLDIHL